MSVTASRIEIDLRESAALLVVDMQNGFCHPSGALARAGLEIGPQRAVVDTVAELVSACRPPGVPVFWSRQEHLEGDRTRDRHRIPTHIEKGGYLPCPRGSWDAEIVEELEPLIGEDDVVFTKHRASCFFDTVLASDLRMRAIDTLVICGVATNYCVDATIRDAYARDYDLLVVEDACGCSFPDLHEATIKNAALFHGQVVRADEVVRALATPARAGDRQ